MSEKVGIIYSPGFGAGWSTWGKPEMALDQELAKAIASDKWELAREIAKKNWPNEYDGGLDDCEVAWVEPGTSFRIEEYDGSESLVIGAVDPIALPWEPDNG